MLFLKKLNLTAEERRALLIIAPAITLIIFVAIIPIINVFYLSLFRNILVFDINYFVGLDNYRQLLQDQRFWNSFFNNFYYTVCAVSMELVLGLTFALILNQKFKFRGIVRTAILIPWIMPTVIAAKFWDIFLNPQDGLLNKVLLFFGIIQDKVNWLGETFWAMHFAIITDIWKYTPFMSLLLLAGLQLIPKDVYEAAFVDGANRVQRFIHVTLPLLTPTILMALLFRTMDSFSSFSIVYVLTGGGPADSTEIMGVYSYKTLFHSLQFGYGSAIAVVVFLCVLVISMFYIHSFKFKEQG